MIFKKIVSVVAQKCNLAIPKDIILSQDVGVQRYASIAIDSCHELLKEYDWEDLITLKKEDNFLSHCDLPSDFVRLLGNIVSIDKKKYKIISLKEHYLSENKFSIYFYVHLGKLYSSDREKTISNIKYYYISNNFVINEQGNYKSNIESDKDSFIFNELLLIASMTWKLKSMIGMKFNDEYNDYHRMLYWAKNRSNNHEIINLMKS